LILDISANRLKGIWFWDLFAIIVLSVLFGFFATSVPELGGTVGYELNLFLVIGKNRDTFDFDFWSDHLRYF
jgi:S-DNA-T family DNA segregation ATPase FtsK/SpoIIIE